MVTKEELIKVIGSVPVELLPTLTKTALAARYPLGEDSKMRSERMAKDIMAGIRIATLAMIVRSPAFRALFIGKGLKVNPVSEDETDDMIISAL